MSSFHPKYTDIEQSFMGPRDPCDLPLVSTRFSDFILNFNLIARFWQRSSLDGVEGIYLRHDTLRVLELQPKLPRYVDANPRFRTIVGKS